MKHLLVVIVLLLGLHQGNRQAHHSGGTILRRAWILPWSRCGQNTISIDGTGRLIQTPSVFAAD